VNIQSIQQRLESYGSLTSIDEHQALREITQEVVLAALGRGDFFRYALFHGGTCLRVFHGLNRFSEDLDFALKRQTPDFRLLDHLSPLADEMASYGYRLEITQRDKVDRAVQKAFLKDDSLGGLLTMRHANQAGRAPAIKVKLEVDTNPPEGGTMESRYLDFPFVSSVATQDLSTMFAGKVHALLCRDYIKGRDWYDLLWFTGRHVGINCSYLASALNQYGPWKGQRIQVDPSWVSIMLDKKIRTLDFKAVVADVRRFVRPNELPSLELWSQELFLSRLDSLS